MNNSALNQPVLACQALSKSFMDGTSKIDVLREMT